MPLFADVHYPRIDLDATRAEIHRRMGELAVEAAKKFVIASTDVIPVLTGGSKASFLKLAFQAKVSLAINPIRKSRIGLGVESSRGEVFVEPGDKYGFSWSSDLYYIHHVDRQFSFVDAGLSAIQNTNRPELPPPVIVSS